ncbi:hypothetical protein BH10ACT11_BH10ACT11_16230 [soil metagenome]
MTPGRVRAVIAALVAIAAALGIALPGGGDDNSSSTSTPTFSSTAAEASTATTTAASTSSTDASTTDGAGSSDTGVSEAGPSPDSEEGVAISRVVGEIDSGHTSQYSQDGTTFENREGHLPSQDYGYYREYTVLTPNSPDRGARRLILGEHGELYYTSDHYDSFTPIDPERYR